MKIILLAILLYSTCSFAQTSKVTVNKNSNGIEVSRDTAKPNQIRIVCAPSKSNVKPLYIINGFVLADSLISQINPSQIKSIDVLKNAAAMEKYGDKAKNGVVIITAKPEVIDELTKKGVLKPVL
jgi:TonB-dependent SusC/RagA subfamily outer membrane receptor